MNAVSRLTNLLLVVSRTKHILLIFKVIDRTLHRTSGRRRHIFCHTQGMLRHSGAGKERGSSECWYRCRCTKTNEGEYNGWELHDGSEVKWSSLKFVEVRWLTGSKYTCKSKGDLCRCVMWCLFLWSLVHGRFRRDSFNVRIHHHWWSFPSHKIMSIRQGES